MTVNVVIMSLFEIYPNWHLQLDLFFKINDY